MERKKLTRRDFLRASAMTAAGVALSACTPKTAVVEETPEVKPTATEVVKPAEVKPTPTEALEVIEINVARDEHPAQPIIQDAPAHLTITEHTGVKLNFVKMPSDDFDAKREVWLATNQVPDLMRATLGDIRDYAAQGVILPLMPLIEAHAPNLKRYIDTYPEVLKLAVDGELYYVPGQYYNWKKLASMPMIRKDILDELGLETPENFDELFEALKAFKEAYPDSAVWTNRNGTKRILSINAYPMGSGFGVYFDKDVDGGKWLFGPIHPEFKDVLDYFARAYEAGILDPDFAITPSDQWHEKNSSDKGLYCWENMSFGVRWNLALRETNPEATWAPLYTLEGKKGRRQTQYGGLLSGYVVGANTKYPERIVKMLDWMITPLGLDVTNWGIEGEHYTLKGTRPETIEDYTIEGIEKALDPTQKELLPEVYEEYAEKSDPFRTYQSETGTGLLDFVVLTDSAVWYIWDPPGETDAWYELTASDPGLHLSFLTPPFTPEESERIKQIQTDVNSILEPAYDNVILGQMSLSEYDQAVAQAIEAGAEELETIYNEAEARLK